MPFDIEEFKRVSVAPAGEQWRARFETCFKAARTVTYATTDEYLGDDSLFGYASRIAIGLALLRARFLDTEARQVAVWDGAGVGGSDRTAGAAADVRVWRQHGLPEEIIKPLEGRQAGSARKPAAAKKKATSSKSNARSIKAMLFGDFHGFSKLREVQVPIFVSEMLGASARILDRQGKGVLFRNTWGDGLYLVMRDVETAANCALEMQETMASFDPASQGLPEDMRLRLGGHLGPVFRIRDPILKRQSFMGAHVSRTARIEPITPEGAVYVTEAFAAVLTSGTSKDFVCEYVGQLQTAKGYGIMRMYSLRRRATGRAVASAS
jgi:class 3 adenylate cyclase